MDPSPQHVVELPGACINSKVKWLLQVVLIFLCLQLATGNIEAICNDDEETDPQAPECLNDCRGRRFFLDVDELCKMCVQCQPGYEHDKECGNGANGDAICIECPEDHYSYNLYDCVACRVCENTLITQECSVSTDRQCGECLPGFYKDPRNPDLCNQRCEWLSNPDTIPACKAWLANQQVTTLSAGIGLSLTSSFSGIIDEGTLRETTIIIIILVLVIVVIGGSVIPVYLCCKHTRSKPTEILVSASGDIERGNSREYPDPGDAFLENDGDDEDSDDGGLTEPVRAQPLVERGALEVANVLPLSTGPQQDGTGGDITERVRATPMKQGASEVANMFPLPNGLEQEDDYGSIENEGEDKDSDQPVMAVFDSRPTYPSCNSHGGKFENSRIEISEDLHTPGMRNEAQTLRSTESGIIPKDNEHIPRGSDSEGAQINEGGAGYDEEDGEQDSGKKEPDESKKLLPDAPLRSRESTVISQDKHKHMQTGPGSEEVQRTAGGEGGNEENCGKEECTDECQKLLQGAEVEDNDGGATGAEKWRGSAEDEMPQPTKRKEKDETHRTNASQLPPPCKCDNQCCKPNIIYQIEHADNVILGHQINNYNSGENAPQGSDEHPNGKDDEEKI